MKKPTTAALLLLPELIAAALSLPRQTWPCALGNTITVEFSATNPKSKDFPGTFDARLVRNCILSDANLGGSPQVIYTTDKYIDGTLDMCYPNCSNHRAPDKPYPTCPIRLACEDTDVKGRKTKIVVNIRLCGLNKAGKGACFPGAT